MRRRIGYVAQGGGTADEVSAREELVLQARLHRIGKAEAPWRGPRPRSRRSSSTDFADRRCKTYSGGQRRRVDIALGIIHQPKVLFLDEPTGGLDPQSRAHMWDEVRRLRDEGITVFLTTHYLDEADALCDRIAIIDFGEIVAEGTPTTLKREIAGDVVTVDLNGATPKAAELLDGKPYMLKLEQRDGGPAAARGRRRDRDPADHARAGRRRASSSRPSSCTGPPSMTCSSPRPAARCASPGRDFEHEVCPRHLAGLPAADPADVAYADLDHRRRSAQPISYLLLFAPLLKPALANPGRATQGDAYRIFVPGLLVLMASSADCSPVSACWPSCGPASSSGPG